MARAVPRGGGPGPGPGGDVVPLHEEDGRGLRQLVVECGWPYTLSKAGGVTTRIRTMPFPKAVTKRRGETSALLMSKELADAARDREEAKKHRYRRVVVELELRVMKFPSESLGLLRHLVKLDMSHNRFVPSHLMDVLPLPLPGLEVLSLDGNRFEGPLPTQLSHFIALRELRLAKNHLTGCLPEAWGMLRNLELLDLKGNLLGGPVLPLDIVKGCIHLRDLRLGNNRFDKLDVPIPCPQLRQLELYSNALRGPLRPPSLAHLPNLKRLDLCGNALDGDIPVDVLAGLPLEVLILNRNDFRAPRVQGARLQARRPDCKISVDDLP